MCRSALAVGMIRIVDARVLFIITNKLLKLTVTLFLEAMWMNEEPKLVTSFRVCGVTNEITCRSGYKSTFLLPAS